MDIRGEIRLPELWSRWKIRQKLGSGKWGAVYAIQLEQQEAALKVISVPGKAPACEDRPIPEFLRDPERAVREYTLMEKLRGHECIVRAEQMRLIREEDADGWTLYIQMELLEPLQVTGDPERLEEQVLRVGMDICSALEHCEKNHILHRDIKPWNIYQSREGQYKLGDFGSAGEVGNTEENWVGTPNYTAPEVHRGEVYSHAADIYGLGMVLYWMLNRERQPFLPLPPEEVDEAMETAARQRRIRGESFSQPVNGSRALREVVMKAVSFAPEERYASAADMGAALKAVFRRREWMARIRQLLPGQG